MKKIFVLLMALSMSGIFAQSSVKFNGQVRPRYEFNNKDFNGGTDAFSYTFLRTRVGAKFAPSDNVSGFVQFQDSRIFGSEPSTMSHTANVDVHQAYFTVKNLFDVPMSLKAGRMEVKYGNERFLGAVGWSNVSRSFDGAVAGFGQGSFNADIFALQEREYQQFGDSLDLSVFGGYFNVLSGATTIQPFFIHQLQNKTDNLSRSTLGIYVKGNIAGIAHELEGAFQTGTVSGKDVSAYMFAVNAGFKFDTPVKPSVSAGFEYLSGDDGSASNKYKVFNTLYATNHKFYGFMDYFLNIPRDTYGLGLVDMHVKLGAAVSKKVIAGLNLHSFSSAQDYFLLGGGTSTSFGTEADLTVKYLFDKYATFVAGFSMFSPGDIFKETRSEDSATWGYVMAVVNF